MGENREENTAEMLKCTCSRINSSTNHQHIAERLNVITTGLRNAQMGVGGSVWNRPDEVLVLLVRDVQSGLRVAVLPGETVIDDVDEVAAFADTHEEVLGLDVSVDKVARVDELDTGNQLVGEEKYGLEAELAIAEVEEVLKRWAAGQSSAEPSQGRLAH